MLKRFRGAGRRARTTTSAKNDAEIAFWRERRALEGELSGPHYADLFGWVFGLDRAFFESRSILDIGCGPRGSLEWCDAAVRVGLDPLAARYLELGTATHSMNYVAAGAEAMPFADGAFDIVASLNSLDHVDDVGHATREIVRVLGPGGTFLLITEVGHEPTPTEPITFGFDIVDSFAPQLAVVTTARYEMRHELVHANVIAAVPYDSTDTSQRSGILTARFEKRSF
jgi:SAM-dependent methyltransferase